jgi:pyrimidine-specific ribonucleoside hydrolase
VVHGLAHVKEGARNLRRLLRVAKREDIPVFEGESEPLTGSREFPAGWRQFTDNLPGVRLPDAGGRAPSSDAVSFLRERFSRKSSPLRILALGPLTNLALAFRSVPDSVATIRDIVTMGGAVEVPGNLRDGNDGSGENDTAEWNVYCDPDAAAEVFAADVLNLLVPLDATNQVPVSRAFVENFKDRPLTPIGQVIADVFTAALPFIDTGRFYAWDPLAAVALMKPSVVQSRGAQLQVVREGKDVGRTRLVKWDESSKVKVAINANAAEFGALYNRAFLA